MTSTRKTQANLSNARKSTGPRTPFGKARAARNAQQHGLSMPVLLDPGWCEEIRTLALEIAGEDASVEQRELASSVAAAEIDVRRVRQARHQMVAQRLNDPNYQKPTRSMLRDRWLRKEHGLSPPEEIVPPHDRNMISESSKHAQILADLSAKMVVMDRYERRALSRRKFAIRAFDSVCVAAIQKKGAKIV